MKENMVLFTFEILGDCDIVSERVSEKRNTTVIL